MKRFFLLLAVAGGMLLVMTGTGCARLWKPRLIVSLPKERADALILLGGESSARPVEAARLYQAGVAPRVFVTGFGDAGKNRRTLIESGVPASAIIMETQAMSTYENAVFLKPMMALSHVESALIVTSPFHTRRALATFRKVMPDVDFGIVSASLARWKTPEGERNLNHLAFLEFFKILDYWVIYGISPFPETNTMFRR